MLTTPLLTAQERADYLRYKFNLKNGLEQAIIAIKNIRDKRLYREEYGTFEAFCQAELEKPRQTINEQIRAHDAIADLEEFLPKPIEHASWVTALNSLDDPLEKKTAIMLAYDAAKVAIPSGKPTAAMFEESVATIKEMKATGNKVDLGGTMSAATASVVVKHNQRVKDAIQDAQEQRGKSAGTVVLIAKHQPCRIVAASAKRQRITFEFDDYATYQKLLRMLQESSNKNLDMKLTQTTTKGD